MEAGVSQVGEGMTFTAEVESAGFVACTGSLKARAMNGAWSDIYR